MEQTTLGRRIAFHRKRLGMTQEQLAERVGVSAQAVSKWENNLSCPDITILPELADIFGISVDELLGRSSPNGHKVRQAEVVHEEEAEHDGGHSIELHLGSTARKGGLWFAIYILCIGGLLLVGTLLKLDVSTWTILWSTALLVGGLSGLVHQFSFFCLGLALAGGYFLLSEFSVLRLNLGWSVVIPGFLLLWGLSLLVDVFRGRRYKKYRGESKDRRAQREYRCADGYLHCELSFGSYRLPIVAPVLRGGDIESNFGDFTVDFSSCQSIEPGCTLHVENSFGSLILLIPDKFQVQLEREDSTAATAEIKGQPAAQTQGVLTISAELNFGSLEIRYV